MKVQKLDMVIHHVHRLIMKSEGNDSNPKSLCQCNLVERLHAWRQITTRRKMSAMPRWGRRGAVRNMNDHWWQLPEKQDSARSGCIADLKSNAWHFLETLAKIHIPGNFQNHFLTAGGLVEEQQSEVQEGWPAPQCPFWMDLQQADVSIRDLGKSLLPKGALKCVARAFPSSRLQTKKGLLAKKS